MASEKMTHQEAIDIINDVTWQDCGRHYGKIQETRETAIAALRTTLQIIHCKDCDYFDPRQGYCYYWDYEPGGSPNRTEEDDFCSHGVPKN